MGGGSRLLSCMQEPAPSPRGTTAFAAGIVLGLVLAIAGWGWTAWSRPTDVWSPEQAAELQAADNAVHQARSPRGKAAGDSQATLKAAERRLAELRAELDHARSVRNDWGRRVAACGLGLTIVCGLGYLASRGR